MAQKKETNKKDVKVQDLAPKKDAKGGGRSAQGAPSANATNRGLNVASSDSSNLNATNRSLD